MAKITEKKIVEYFSNGKWFDEIIKEINDYPKTINSDEIHKDELLEYFEESKKLTELLNNFKSTKEFISYQTELLILIQSIYVELKKIPKDNDFYELNEFIQVFDDTKNLKGLITNTSLINFLSPNFINKNGYHAFLKNIYPELKTDYSIDSISKAPFTEKFEQITSFEQAALNFMIKINKMVEGFSWNLTEIIDEILPTNFISYEYDFENKKKIHVFNSIGMNFMYEYYNKNIANHLLNMTPIQEELFFNNIVKDKQFQEVKSALENYPQEQEIFMKKFLKKIILTKKNIGAVVEEIFQKKLEKNLHVVIYEIFKEGSINEVYELLTSHELAKKDYKLVDKVLNYISFRELEKSITENKFPKITEEESKVVSLKAAELQALYGSVTEEFLNLLDNSFCSVVTKKEKFQFVFSYENVSCINNNVLEDYIHTSLLMIRDKKIKQFQIEQKDFLTDNLSSNWDDIKNQIYIELENKLRNILLNESLKKQYAHNESKEDINRKNKI